MAFWDKFLSVIEAIPVGLRVISDTAIDGANLVTGMQFQDKMDAAKQKLSDIGFKTPSDAIKDVFFDDLPGLRDQVQAKHDAIVKTLMPQSTAAVTNRDAAQTRLANMLDDVRLLAQMSLDAQAQYEKASHLADWQVWAHNLGDSIDAATQLQKSFPLWDSISQKVLLANGAVQLTNLAAAATSGVVWGLQGATAALKASKAIQAGTLTTEETAKAAAFGVKVGSEGLKVATTAMKLARIASLADKASVVLSFVSMGVDVALSVSQMQDQRETAQENITTLDTGITAAQKEIANMTAELGQINARFQELIASVTPATDAARWDAWVNTQRVRMRSMIDKLGSILSVNETALNLARSTRKLTLEERVAEVQSVDSRMTQDEAKALIALADEGQQQNAALLEQAYVDFQGPPGGREASLLNQWLQKTHAIHTLAPELLKLRAFPAGHAALAGDAWWKQLCSDQIDHDKYGGKTTQTMVDLEHALRSVSDEICSS